MKTLYLECNMGAAGDMLMAALTELCPDPDGFIAQMNRIGLKDTAIAAVKIKKQGITGRQIKVILKGEVEEETADVPDQTDNPDHHHDPMAHHHNHHNHHQHGDNDDHHYDNHQHNDNEDHQHDKRQHNDHDSHQHDKRQHNESDNHHHDDHQHAGLNDILTRIDSLDIPTPVRDKARAVYTLLAEAEAHVHDCPVGDIHFHEVGTLDAIADIVGCCLALDQIAADRIVVSPIHVGSGQVRCQHGLLPVPAPATAYLLRNAPIYGGAVKGELCTPTGAALLQAFADSYGPMPTMVVDKIGYGMGKKDFDRLNCLRAFLGEDEPRAPIIATDRHEVPKKASNEMLNEVPKKASNEMLNEVPQEAPNEMPQEAPNEVLNEVSNETPVFELSCALDDMTAEAIAFAYDMLFAAGALDVYAAPIMMKKGRPGHLLTALAKAADKEAVATALLTHTTTRGIRLSSCERMTMSYRHEAVATAYGMIEVKLSSGYGVSKAKPEYDQVAAAAKAHQVGFATVSQAAITQLGERH